MLNKKGIKHIVLNAKNHEKEAEIIANAGKINSIIITTSISGRGVDIKLGGQDERDKTEIKKAVDTIRQSGCEDLLLFHCISAYPTPLASSKLGMIKML
mgnify:CR=1 FL=1